jgi:hypothetical protein
MMTSLRFFGLLFLGLLCWANSLGACFNWGFSEDTPVATNVTKPAYPPIAVVNNINGTVLVDVRIDSRGIVRKAWCVSGPALLRKSSEEAAKRWRFNCVKTTSGMRSARLSFIYRPITHVRKEGESDYTAPYTIAVSWESSATTE